MVDKPIYSILFLFISGGRGEYESSYYFLVMLTIQSTGEISDGAIPQECIGSTLRLIIQVLDDAGKPPHDNKNPYLDIN
jgi:hypothetical protein